MSEKIEIKKVVIQIGDIEAGLTIEQARELKDALNELLGEKEVEKVYIPDPYPVWREPHYRRPYWTITWGDTKTTGTKLKDLDWTTVTYSLSQ